MIKQQYFMINKATTYKQLCFIGAAIHQGQIIEGVEKTPDILRSAGLFQSLKNKFDVEIFDQGNVSAKDYDQKQQNQLQLDNKVKNLPILDSLLEKINNKILSALQHHQNSVIVTVGGDHSIGTATLHAMNTHYKNLRVIWVDAHPDFIDSSISSYYGYHGYPVAHITGLSKFPGFQWIKNIVPFENIVLIAIRDIDPDEWINLKKHKIKCFTMDHVVDLGIGEVVSQAIDYLDPKGDRPFHISFDIDAIDPSLAQGTGTKFRGGLTDKQANLIVRKVAHLRKLVGLDVVEVNDALQLQDQRMPYRGQNFLGPVSPTVGLGIDLIESIFTQYYTL